MQIALDKNNNRIYIKDFNKSIDEAHCPCCNEKLIARQGSVNTWCFAHRPDSNCLYKDDNNTMSPWHIDWQSLFPLETREVFKRNNAGEIRRADILLEDKKIEIEFQHSPITKEEISARNKFWNDLGYTTIWVLDCQNAYIHSESIFWYSYEYVNKALTKNEAVLNKQNLLFLDTKFFGILLVTGTKHNDLSIFASNYSFTKNTFLDFTNKLDNTTLSTINNEKEKREKEAIEQKINERADSLREPYYIEDEYENEYLVGQIPYFFCDDRDLKYAIFDIIDKTDDNFDIGYLVFRQDVKFRNGKWEVWGFKIGHFEHEITSRLTKVPKATLNKWTCDDENSLDFFLLGVPKFVLDKKEELESSDFEDECFEDSIVKFDNEGFQEYIDKLYNGKGYDEEHNSIPWYFKINPEMQVGIFINQSNGIKVMVNRYNIDNIPKYHKLYGTPFNKYTDKKMPSSSVYYYKNPEWKLIWFK